MSKTAETGGPFNQVQEDAARTAVEEDRQSINIEHLVRQIKESADKFLRDKASRGDVKLVSTAIKELRYAFKVFAQYRDRRKVTVFGSARINPDHPAYKQAVEFGRRMAEENFMVVTGAASGIMEAGHVGAGLENSLGVNILLPFEQAANSVIAGDGKLVHLKYFFTRKLMFVKEADAVALFPGGFGTQDENMEALTLVQTGKSHMFPIVLIDQPGGVYWKKWFDFVEAMLLEEEYISPADLSLFKITDSVDEAVAEITRFYRIYHSMRYVGDAMVFRIKQRLSAAFIQRINREFADILVGGAFEQMDALPAEANDPHLAALPRLRFHFDRKSLGRLRELIDAINRED